MSFIESWLGTPGAMAIGWTLVHFVWEGALLALLLAGALCIIRSSRARYAAACLGMLTMLAAFGLTFAHLMPQPTQGAATAVIRPMVHGSDEQSLGTKSALSRSPTDFLPWLVPFWVAGVLVFHLRTLASWIAAQRLRRVGVCYAPDFWQKRLDQLAARLRLSSPVMLFESCLADVPVVIGYVRPVILMPVGLLVGLPAGQVESILLHELAHISRYDYLVNLFLTSLESLLFYHPAAWWISGVIRAERENCCDDLVVAMNGDVHEYAAALAALEQNRCAVREAALAATGGSIVKRIRRLLFEPERPRAGLTPVFSLGILTITTALVLAGWQMPASKSPLTLLAQVQQPPAPPPVVSSYTKWLNEDVAYIITNKERAAFQLLQTDAERQHFIEQFWLVRDPNPGSSENEFKEEHYRRIAYANEHFGTNVPGWKTDRGRIYIMWGPPDEIDSHPSGGAYERPPADGGGVTSTFPFEDWRYRYIEGLGNNISLEFVDKTGSGDFRMTMDPHEKETTPNIPQAGGSQQSQPHAIFVSQEPGSKATVAITPDRRMVISVPVDFDAKEYSITGTTRASDGRISRTEFTAVVSLCKNSPGALACLERPVFYAGPSDGDNSALDPGSYTFNAMVKDLAGTVEKTYTVNFDVN
jgi:GWxTD domain-containing protein